MVFPQEIKYHTADKQHVFCDAYCSHDWYQKHPTHEGSMGTDRNPPSGT